MTKTELHRLVDALPDQSLDAAAVLLRRAQDPVVAELDAAPYDDEEFTEEDEQPLQQDDAVGDEAGQRPSGRSPVEEHKRCDEERVDADAD